MKTTLFPGFDNLDAFAQIFNYLSPKDLGASKLVCSTWNKFITEGLPSNLKASSEDNDESLKRKFSIFQNISSLDLSESKNISENAVLYIVNKSPNLKTIDLSGCSQLKIALGVIGNKCTSLKSISIKNCTQIADKEIKSFSKKEKKHLETVDVSNCKNITHDGFVSLFKPSIKSAYFDNCSELTNATLEALGKICKNLESLSLAECKISDRGLSYLNFSSLIQLNVEGCNQLSEKALLEVFSRAPKIKSINFSRCQVSELTISTLIDKAEALEEVILDGCNQVTDQDISKLIQKSKNIKKISLHNWPNLTAQSILNVILLGEKLKTFNVNGVDLKSQNSSAQGSWTHPVLDFSLFPSITDRELKILTKSAQHIQQLKADGCASVTSQGVIQLLKCCPSLNEIDLSNCKNIDHVFLRYICNPFSNPFPYNLKKLTLRGCHQIQDHHLTREPKIRPLQNLKHLDVNGCKHVGHEGILAFTQDCISLQHLLAIDTKVTDEGWQLIASTFSNLEYVEVGSSATDASLYALSNCSNLKSVTVSGSSEITSDGISYILENCTSLQTLRLINCSNLNDKAIDEISRHGRKIEHFALLGSPFVQPEALLQLFKSITTLKSVELGEQLTDTNLKQLAINNRKLQKLVCSKSKQLTTAGIESLALLCSNMEILEIDYCFKVHLQEVKDLNKLPLKKLKYTGGNLCLQAVDEYWLSAFHQLEELDLSQSECSTNSIELIAKLGQLKSLNLSECVRLQPQKLQMLATLKNLRSLSLKGQKINDQIFASFIRFMPSLEKLDLSYCIDLTDNSISALASSSPQLRQANFENCRYISEVALFDLLRFCPFISNLNVKGCPHIFSSFLISALEKGVSIEANRWNNDEIDISDYPDATDRDIEIISNFAPHVRSLILNGCDKLTDISLKHLVKLRFLEKLSLKDCSNISPQALNNLAEIPTLLTLNLQNWKRLGTGAEGGTDCLSKIKNLKELSLESASNIKDEDVFEIAKLNRLEHLNLNKCYQIVKPNFFKLLSSLVKLKSLSLSEIPYVHAKTTPDDYLHLKNLPSFESLDLSFCNLSDENLQAICKIENLTALNIECNPLQNSLSSIGNLLHLKTLNVGSCHIDDWDVYAWRNLTELRSLNLSQKYINITNHTDHKTKGTLTGNAIEWIASFSKLEALELRAIETATKQQMEKIAKLENLQHLSLAKVSEDVLITYCNSFKNLLTLETPVLVPHIAHLSKLQTLEISTVLGDCDDKCLESIGQLTELTELSLCCKSVTDKGIKSVGQLTNLKTLKLYNIDFITSAGLNSLSNLLCLESFEAKFGKKIDDTFNAFSNWKRLKEFSLEYSSISGSSLYSLSDCKNLKKLNLSHNESLQGKFLIFVSSLKSLNYFNLESCDSIDDTGVEHIGKCTSLTNLKIGLTEIGPTALRYISGLKNLKELSLLGCRNLYDASFFSPLSRCTALEDLDLSFINSCSNHPFVGEGFDSLLSCIRLKRLNLTSNVLDSKSLHNLKHISTIVLKYVSFSNLDIENLKKALPYTLLENLKETDNL